MAATKEPVYVPPKVKLHSNLENQDRYTTRSLPRMAKALCDVAEISGWEYRVGWSLAVVPAGYRESNHHKAAEVAYLQETCGVWLRAFHTKACAMWVSSGPGVPKSVAGSQGAVLWLPGRVVMTGVEALIGYIRGDNEI